MVYAFLLLTLASSTDKGEILYSEVFSADELEDSSESCTLPIRDRTPSGESNISGNKIRENHQTSRRERKLCLQTIANRIAVEYTFHYGLSGKSGRDEIERLRMDGIVPEFTSGMFGLLSENVEPYFARQKHVVWCGALGNCCAALVLNPEENRSLAESSLTLIFRSIHEYARVLDNPREVQLKPDYVIAVLRHLLPGGRLTFANRRFVHHLEKKLEKSMNLLMNS